MFFFISSAVYSFEEVEKVKSNTVNLGNGICEYYSKTFEEVGTSDSIVYMGNSLEIEFLGVVEKEVEMEPVRVSGENNDDIVKIEENRVVNIAMWSLNGVEGENLNDLYNDQFDNGEDWRMHKGHISAHERGESQGYVSIDESHFESDDCLGIVKDEWGNAALYREVSFEPGWNLVANNYNFRYCHSEADEICEQDILVEYHLNSLDQKFYSKNQIENYMEREVGDEELRRIRTEKREYLESMFDSEEEVYNFITNEYFTYIREGDSFLNYFDNEINLDADEMSSRWVYFKDSVKGKTIRANHGLGEREVKPYPLFKGWNFIVIDENFLFDRGFDFSPLKFNEMKGSCTFEKIYRFDSVEKVWVSYEATEVFDSEKLLDEGLAIKVLDDCNLGLDIEFPLPPGIPVE